MMQAFNQVVAGLTHATLLPSIDFETFSEAGYRWDDEKKKWKSLPGLSDQNRGLGAVGVRNYVQHPSFQLLCLTYDLLDGHGPTFWRGDEPYDKLQRLFAYVRAGGLLSAWNSGFEFQVWQYHCVPKLGWPSLNPDDMRCDMSKARGWALAGKMGETGKILNLANKKDTEGDRLIRKLTVPRNPTKKDLRRRVSLTDQDPDWSKFFAYNVQDVLVEMEACQRIPDLSPEELEIWQVDQRINNRGIQVDSVGVENCIAIVEQAHAKYNHELALLTGGRVEAASELDALKAWIEGEGIHMYSMDAEAIEDALNNGRPLPDHVRRALQIRQLVGSASVKKLFSMRAQSDTAGRLYDLYSYYAARTGRWTGNGPQPQNLYKGKWTDIATIERALMIISFRSLELVEYEYGDALEAVNNCLRSLFIAKPGHKLISSDYSAIEGVVTAALAGEEWRLEVFRTHGMIYETSASRIVGVPFEEFVRHKKETGKHHPQRNLIGKFAELASGFGGWINAWKNFGAGDHLDDDQIKKAILAWRAASPMIVELWGGQSRGRFQTARPELFGLEGIAIKAVLYPGEHFTYRDISFHVHDDVLYMRLPSGRHLVYHKPRLEQSTRPYANPWEYELTFEGWNGNREKGPLGWLRMKLYGGILTENAVQAVARDIQARALVLADQASYSVVMHTHDELVCEVPEDFGDVAGLESIMMDLALWCAHWPIKAKGGWQGFRYGKFD